LISAIATESLNGLNTSLKEGKSQINGVQENIKVNIYVFFPNDSLICRLWSGITPCSFGRWVEPFRGTYCLYLKVRIS
jgi:hypothetical protein